MHHLLPSLAYDTELIRHNVGAMGVEVRRREVVISAYVGWKGGWWEQYWMEVVSLWRIFIFLVLQKYRAVLNKALHYSLGNYQSRGH